MTDVAEIPQAPPADLEVERRRGRLAGVAAFVSAAAFIGGLIASQPLNVDRPAGSGPALVRFYAKHSDMLVWSSVARAIAFALLAVVAFYLFEATKARNPRLPDALRWLGVIGFPVVAGASLASSVRLADAAKTFAARDAQTVQAARDILQNVDSPLTILIGAFLLAGMLSVCFWLVTASSRAMRVGILTKPMGVLGIALGAALFLSQFAPLQFLPILLILWLLALGALFLGYWPGGRPPAWQSGRAEPWPSRPRRDSAVS